MTWGDAVLLGLVQGLTEFFPISSSGHLVLAQHLLGVREPQLLFDIVVHAGTLFAVVVALWPEIRQLWDALVGWLSGRHPERARLLGWLAVATVPAGVAGLVLDPYLEPLFASPTVTAVALLLTGVWLVVADSSRGSGRLDSVDGRRALGIGLAQAVAIVPGISRSGATIATGMQLGLEREAAGRFSFLLSIPTIAGAVALGMIRGMAGTYDSPGSGVLLTGFVAAAVAGYAAIGILLGMLRRHRRLLPFAIYVWVVGLAALVAWR